MVLSERSSAWRCTSGETPWAENTTVWPVGHLVELLDEDRAARLEVGHDVLVVHDLLADVDGRAVEVERLLHGDHRPVDAGAVAARRRQQDGLLGALRRQDRGHAHVGASWRPVYGAVRRCRPLISPAWPLETSLESPAPVRQIANAIAGWVDRLGAVWVEGQVAQVNRRPGHEHRLHDPARRGRRHLGDGHLLAHALRRAQPAGGRGRERRRPRQAVLLRQPRHASRSTPATSGWSASASCSPASSAAASCSPPRGSSPPSSSAPLPFLPGTVGLVTAPNSRRRARRARERPAALAGGQLRGRLRRDAGPALGRRGDRGASSGSTATRPST